MYINLIIIIHYRTSFYCASSYSGTVYIEQKLALAGISKLSLPPPILHISSCFFNVGRRGGTSSETGTHHHAAVFVQTTVIMVCIGSGRIV